MAQFSNWDDVDDAPRGALEVGIYVAEVVNAEPFESQAANNPGVKYELKVLSKIDGSPAAGKIYGQVMFLEKTQFQIKQIARSANLPKSDWPSDDSEESRLDFAAKLSGEQVYLQTKLEESPKDGKKYARVDFFMTEEEAKKRGSGSTESTTKTSGIKRRS